MSVARAVIDTNVLVAAGINAGGKPAQVLAAVERLMLQPVISAEVMVEYRAVLMRPQFHFQAAWIDGLLDTFDALGLRLEPAPIDTALLPDPSDAPFIALALQVGCPVITGNTRHFPARTGAAVLTPAQWVESFIQQRG